MLKIKDNVDLKELEKFGWNDTMLVGKVCNMINEIVDQQIKSLKGKK